MSLAAPWENREGIPAPRWAGFFGIVLAGEAMP
jgi:hypothetical protein